MRFRNLHAFDDFRAAGQGLAFASVAKLVFHFALPARRIPTKAAVGNRLERDVLKTTQQRIFFRHVEGLAKHFDLHQFRKRIEEVQV